MLFAVKKEYFEVFFFREMAQIAPNYFKTTQQLLQNYPKTTRSSSNYPRVETTLKLPLNYPKQMNGLLEFLCGFFHTFVYCNTDSKCVKWKSM